VDDGPTAADATPNVAEGAAMERATVVADSAPRPPHCWLVTRSARDGVVAGVAPLPWDPGVAEPGEAVVAVEAAGFNYKDALACTGHPGVMRPDRLVPGIDAAGRLVTPVAGLPAGAAVVVGGGFMGERRDGGFATHVRMPPEAVLPRPGQLDAREAMALGTAALSAVLLCERLGPLVEPRAAGGEWLVTGASGGVGMCAVARLVAEGRQVVACSRKPEARDVLLGLGAASVATPREIVAPGDKSLAAARWTGVIDAVGGPLLADVLRSVRPGGAVGTVGMTGGHELKTTVHPFILRGITLTGVDTSAGTTPADRARLWACLAELWAGIRGRVPITLLGLDEVGSWAGRMLAGETMGRGVVVP
jgi:putative YhdH/YhfP family quinone oxidoreductase